MASGSGQQFASANRPSVDDRAAAVRVKVSMQSPPAALKPQPCMLKTGVSDAPKAKDDALAVNAQKKPDCLTLQLGDALLDVFKTMTDRH
jgi:hypothetical protein